MPGDVFIDILPRLNMGMVDKILADCKRKFQIGGTEAGKDMSKGFDIGIADLSRNAEVAFRDVTRSMAQMDAAVADRVAAFNKGADEMINSEKRVQAAIAETQRALEASREADAAVMAGSRAPQPDKRKPLIPIPRGINAAGAGVTAGVAAFFGYGIDQDIKARSNMNVIQRNQMGMPNAESMDNIGRMTQWAYQNAGQFGQQSSVNNLTQALQQAEAAGYRGQNAMNLVQTAFKEATVTGAGFQETLSALNTQLRDTHEQTDKVNASLQQMQTISSQNVRAFGNVPLTPEQRSQLMESTHSYEPTLTALSPNANPDSVLAQAQAAMMTLVMTGESPDQSAQNLSHFFQTLNLNPGSKAWKMFAQLGGNPQNLSTVLQNEGPLAAFQKIQAMMASKTGPDGLIHTGLTANNEQLNQVSSDVLAGLSPAAQNFINSSPDVQAGIPKKKQLRDAVDSGEISVDDVQAILGYSHMRAQATGLNPNVAKGGEINLTPTQVVQAMFGNADTSRTFDILNQAGKQLADRLNSILNGGKQNILEDSFNKAMSGDVAAKWHALGDSAGGLAARMSNDLLPVLDGVVNGLKDFMDFLSRDKIAADALAIGMGTVAAAWTTAKVINMFAGIYASFAKLTGAVTAASTKIVTGATTLATEEAAAGTTLTTELNAAGATSAAKIEAGATTAGAELATVGGAFKTALLGAIPAALEVFLPSYFGNKIANKIDGTNTSQTDVIKQGLQAPGKILGMIDGQLDPNTGQPYTAAPGSPQRPIPPGAGKLPFRPTPGRATGGMIDQSLMGMPDMGGDSILGMLPNGQPVGLRGGEGILTPDAVAAIGGEDGVDALNNNPWSNPFKVGTTFYNSFAQGVAKYSPWGKYMAATGQSLSDLERQQEDADKLQRRADKKYESQTKNLADYMIDFYSDKYAAVGDKYAGPSLSSILNHPYRYEYGTPSSRRKGVMGAIDQAAADMGLSKGQLADVRWILKRESGFDPSARNPSSGAYGLGQFLGHENDKYGQMGAYSGDPYQESRAAIQYMMDRYGGPAGAKAYWKTHGNYATGGVIPTSPHKAPAPAKKPAPSTHPSHPAKAPQTKPQPGKKATGKQPATMDDIMHSLNAELDKNAKGQNPNDDRNILSNPSQQLTAEGKGLGISGGIIGAAESAVTSAASAAGNFFAPGSGSAASSLAQPLFDLTNRAIGYGGQLLGIGIEGLIETALPNDSPGADPSKNIFGKMALGIAGAHPSGNNMAGSHAKQLEPKKDLDKGAMQAKQQPSIHTEFHGDIHNHTGDHSETAKAVNHANQIATFAGI